eukprot:scaffold20285_cov107-Skeletonema_dohrnii-CCMP3373.AAC.1
MIEVPKMQRRGRMKLEPTVGCRGVAGGYCTKGEAGGGGIVPYTSRVVGGGGWWCCALDVQYMLRNWYVTAPCSSHKKVHVL